MALLLTSFFLAIHDGEAGFAPPEVLPQVVEGPWAEAVGVAFSTSGHGFVWERTGQVWSVEADGETNAAAPVLDLSDEVGAWRDHGLLGVALHPAFEQNGWIYLAYVVDRHHLMFAGTENYDPNTDTYFEATIARLTRYQLSQTNDDEWVLVPGSRTILIGSTPSSGLPILHQSHGIGTLMFAEDGTLLLSFGDSASYGLTDVGGQVPGGYITQALGDGIIRPQEDIGAFRSQFLGSHCGKILRLDPETGNGVDSNPFFDPLAPDAPQSRVWSLGLRNPFRFTIQPETGAHLPSDGDPGVILVSDVGWNVREEISQIDAPGLNLGWPIFEGLTEQNLYAPFIFTTENTYAPNPLGREGTPCPNFFSFGDLLVQDQLSDPRPLPNPCDPTQSIPTTTPQFVHRRPIIDWVHAGNPVTRVPLYNADGEAIFSRLGLPDSPVAGDPFVGKCAVILGWLGPQYGPVWGNTLLVGDYASEWVRSFSFSESGELSAVTLFNDVAGAPVWGGTNPITNELWISRWQTRLDRLVPNPSGNIPPVAQANANTSFGPSPFTVEFVGEASIDPDGTVLQWLWDFGDGSTSTAPNPTHTFVNQEAPNPAPRVVTLTVTDVEGDQDQATILIGLDASPPEPNITSIQKGTTYGLVDDTILDLFGEVQDDDGDVGAGNWRWRTILHHNDHTHPEPWVNLQSTQTVLSPLGCGIEDYWYRIQLEVTDSIGLTGTDEIEVFPACPGCPEDLDANGEVDFGDVILILSGFGGTAPDVNGDGQCDFADLVVVLSVWGTCQ